MNNSKQRICMWCHKKRPYTKYKNRYKKICNDCLTIRFKFGKFIISFD